MCKQRIWFGLFILVLSDCASATTTTTVVYPKYESASDTRFDDLIEILQVALEKTVPEYGPFRLKPSEQKMGEARYLSELKQRFSVINVVWTSTSNDKEKDFIPLRIPLRKGILGYRIALISRARQNKIDRVKTLDDLRLLSVGQGIGWGDIRLYDSSGIQVMTAKYENLFPMVTLGRFDLFPRGIGEVFTEYAAHASALPNLAIEKHLLIYYPWPYYFFFNRKDMALKLRVEAGLRKMIGDGSFDSIFYKYNRKAIEQADLKNRRVINIPNDMLPKATPLRDASLWFDPARYKPAK